jgi:hypothetical protein
VRRQVNVNTVELYRFQSCPIASRFVDTREDALSYYAHKLVGDHHVTPLGGVPIVVRFNLEEIHLFTDERTPCPPECVVHRPGVRAREVRCFSVERARRMDLILPTVEAPVTALRARKPGATMLFGPPDPSSTYRLCVVVAPGARVYFVRTAYPVDPTSYRNALKSPRAPWPPK